MANVKAPPSAKVSEVISSFAPTRRFGPHAHQKPYSVTSLDFDDTGELALVAQDDETIQIYNCKEGKHAKELKSQKYGVDIARFTHHPQSVIYASTKGDDHIRYLSTHDNSYIRYFRGHTAAVNSITLSPSSDEFLSTSLDNTMRLWDLRSQHPQGHLDIHAPSFAAYDPTATVMAVSCAAAQMLLMYDVRNYDKEPFATFDIKDLETACAQQVCLGAAGNAIMRTEAGIAAQSTARGISPPRNWTKLEFSNDGKKILLGTNGTGHYVLDSFHGNLVSYCVKSHGSTNRISPEGLPHLRERQKNGQAAGSVTSSQGDMCFSPDGRYVIGGSGDSELLVWDLDGLSPASNAKIEKKHILQPSIDLTTKGAGSASVVGYNPRHNLLITADKAVVFWLPDID